ncbi:MAG: WD40 repeat domain-containing protein [Nitrospinales bacterium]
MIRIFINYRADELGYARLLYQRMGDSFGIENVFMGAGENKPSGDEIVFREKIELCDTMLVLIGPKWHSTRNTEYRSEFFQEFETSLQEIKTALKQPRITVIPILLDGSKMPEPQYLPPDLVELASRQAFPLTSDAWEREIPQLIESILVLPPSRASISPENAEAIELLRVLPEKCEFVMTVAFAPDNRTLATGGADSKIRLWRIADGRQMATLSGHTMRVTCIAFSRDGHLLASSSADGSLRLWQIQNQSQLKEMRANKLLTSWLHRHFAGAALEVVSGVAFSPSGAMIASGQYDTYVRVWKTKDGTLLKRLKGHTDCVTSVAFSPDGTLLASGSWDGTVRLWSVESWKCVRVLIEERLCYGPVNPEMEPHLKGFWVVNSVNFSPDGSQLAAAWGHSTVRLWQLFDTTSGQLHEQPFTLLIGEHDPKAMPAAAIYDEPGLGPTVPGLGGVTSVAFSPDGRTFASGADDFHVRLWDCGSNGSEPLKVFKDHTAGVSCVTYSPDGKTLSTSGWDGRVALYGVSKQRL